MVVPNFIDISKYNRSFLNCQRDMLASEEEKIITHISNFRKVKRIDDVVRIFDKIQKKIKSKLIMVGQGPERKPAEDLVAELGIENKVLFLGESNEIDKILRFTDLFLLPSERESFGLAALEAMAHSVPVISTNSGGLPEVNIDGITGYLSEVGAVDKMALDAISILANEDRLEEFRKNAQNQACKFDILTVVPDYEKLYQKALELNL